MNTQTNYATDFCSENLTGINLLEKNVADYPASSVARLMLLYHYKKTNNPQFEELAKQTGIYLNNPSWIQFQLNQISPEEHKRQEIVDAVKHLEEENLPAPEGGKEISFEEKKQELISKSENKSVEKELPANEIFEEIPERSDDENNKETIADKELLLPVNEQTIENVSLKNEPEKELPFEEKKEELISKFENTFGEKELPANEIFEEIPERLDDENNKETVADNEELSLPVNEQINGNISLENEPEKELFLEEKKEELPETKSEDKNSPSTANEEITGNSVSKDPIEEKSFYDIKIPEKEQKESEFETSELNLFPEETDETEISFEPLHTVDYFASQGIKISEEDLTNDHLGKQVKSFTAWLKSMKKLHPGQLPDQNEVVEKIIQSASESSNQDAHVLTEAMAEVLVKQNKKEKAIEMYQKLSLLNPSKIAYFAAKIESLKIV